MIEQLIHALRREALDPTAEELADALWLLSRIAPPASPKSRVSPLSVTEPREPAPSVSGPRDPPVPESPPQVSRGQRRGSIRSDGATPTRGAAGQPASSMDVHQAAASGAPAELARKSGIPFRSPRAPALPGALDLGRALRPLKRRVPSRVAFTLDEETTAQRIAEKLAFPLALRSRLERWLDVILVVEESPSMVIWQRTVHELQSLLERHGAFRQVRRLALLDDNPRGLRLASSPVGGARREVRRRELIDLGGRRLFLLVSDCVSSCWEDGRLGHWIQDWGRHDPVAVVQVLPERLWHRSALGQALPVRLRAPFPAAGNLHLQSAAASWVDEDDVHSSSRVSLPVIELDRGSIEPWAKQIAGSGRSDIGGVMLSAATWWEGTDALYARGGTVAEGSAVPTARERVARFRATASPRARQLATLFASANYLSLPVMWQIRQVMLPDATAGNLAEVFLGGLLREASTDGQVEESDLVRYEFFEGVRELLLDAVDGPSAVQVLELVSDYVSARLGYATSFRALLMNPTSAAGEAIPEREQPFARVGASVLARLGGQYARLAERLLSRKTGTDRCPPQHLGGITGIAVTEAGRRGVSASRDKTLKVWDLDTGQELATLKGHRDWIRGCAISRDGKWAVSASRDGWLRVWNLETHAERLSMKGHVGAVLGCAVTDDGKRAVSASSDGSLKVWDLETGSALTACRGHSDWVLGCAVTRDGRRAVSASRDGTLGVWELESGKRLATLQGHEGAVNGCAVSADGRVVVSASEDKTLKVWELESGRLLATLQGHEGAVNGCAVSADGRLAVSASNDWTLKVWELRSGRCLRTLNGDGSFTSVALTRDGIWAGDMFGKVWVLPLALKGIEPAPASVEASAGAPASSDGQPVLRPRQPVHGLTDESSLTLKGHYGSVNACAVLGDGRRVLSASDDGTLMLWDVNRGQVLSTLLGHESQVYGCAVTPDGRRAVSASRDWTLKSWTLGNVEAQSTWAGHEDWVRGCAVTPDGKRVVSASDDWTLKVWELATNRVLTTLHGHGRGIWSCAVTPDGRWVISASEDKTLKVWDLARGREVTTLMGHEGGVWCCAVAPDGKRVVSASRDGTLKVWELLTGRELVTLRGHEDEVCGCAVAPDGKRVVSASRDGTVKVWDLEAGRELRTLTGHSDAVLGCAVMPDGRRAVSVSEDWTLKVSEIG